MKKVFCDEVVHLIRTPADEVKGLIKHKKLSDFERDKHMEKLQILHGEIMAGNKYKK